MKENIYQIWQRKWFLPFCMPILLILSSSVFFYNFFQISSKTENVRYTTYMSVKQIAPQINVSANYLIRELKLPLNTKRNIPLHTLGVSQKNLASAISSSIFKSNNNGVKIYFFGLFALCGAVFLSFFNKKKTKTSYKNHLLFFHIFVLSLSVLICGFILGKAFNPMETSVRAIKSLLSIKLTTSILLFIFFIGISILGNKLICGWACPLGALQELLFYISQWLNIKRFRIPFRTTNTIRISLFFVFLFVLAFSQPNFAIYHYINPFNLFDFHFKPTTVFIAIVFILFSSFFFYRPFCRLLCPFGLISWIFERISFFKIRINTQACKQCKSCLKACPTGALQSKVMKEKWVPDCFSCGRCLNICSFAAIRYRKKKLNSKNKQCQDQENADG